MIWYCMVSENRKAWTPRRPKDLREKVRSRLPPPQTHTPGVYHGREYTMVDHGRISWYGVPWYIMVW